MTRVTVHKTSFTAGEVSDRLLGRGDLRAYENGARRLRNVFIHPTGGVSRRAGLRFVDAARGSARLVAFEFNTEQVYLLVVTDGWLDVYRDDGKIASVATPWGAAHLPGLVWTQSADTLLVVHPDVAPRRVTRTADESWTIEHWTWVEEEGARRLPFHKFGADAVTLAADDTTGTVTLTASADVFTTDHVGVRFRIARKQVEITDVASAASATADVKETLTGTDATTDWEEAAFSVVRGWPATVAFHQDRLVIGGSRDLPNRLWLSKSGDLFNFDLGTGLDDEAIEFPILSDRVNAIRAVFSGRHLQLFTSGAEWMVTGDPLTSASVQLKRQTRIGSPVGRSVPPRDVDGATLFVARSGRELREFLFTDVEQAYQATDLALLARHLFVDPLDQDYDSDRRLLHVVMGDGSLATLTVYRAEEVTAWTRQETAGAFRAVAVVGDSTYVLVERAGGHFVEVFDDALATDSALVGDSETASAVWAGLAHLDGATVKVRADGTVRPDAVVTGGAVAVDHPAFAVEAGLPFAHEVEPLPPAVVETGSSIQGATIRPVVLTFRLLDTGALRVDVGRGPQDVVFRRMGPAGVLDAPAPRFTGDRRLRALGWRRDGTGAPWRVAQDTPLPCTILSVTTQLKVSD